MEVALGRPLSDYDLGTARQNVCLFPYSQRTYHEAEQESTTTAKSRYSSPNCFVTATGLRLHSKQGAKVNRQT